jgi:hypothetical protein
MAVAKLSMTIDSADLGRVRAEAKRLRSGVSTVSSEAVSRRRALRAQQGYLKAAGPIDGAELRKARRELDG